MADDLAPAGDYAVAAVLGGQVAVCGMTPKVDGRLVRTGRLGAEIDLAEGRLLAAVAAERAVRAARGAVGADAPLGPAAQVTVYVAVAGSFTRISEVADGASQVWWQHLGALPARAAVGVARLPGDAPVEVALTVGLQAGAG